ncbi:MAG: hypothetical protein IT512_12010 [Rhodocyclaceae bacterium]|nr:hypothetical protein [Rhodocyclaceae bacterium]
MAHPDAPAHAGSLITAMLSWSESRWRDRLRAMPQQRRLALFDQYYELAEFLERLPRWPEGSDMDDRRYAAYTRLLDFAWRLNDLVADLHARLRQPPRRRLPSGARQLLAARRRGRVPVPVRGAHASVGLRPGYRPAAPGAFLVAPAGGDYRALDFACLAGLTVDVLTTKADLLEVDPLARELAAQGAKVVRLRPLDHCVRPEILYDGSKPWRPSSR